MTSCSFSPKGNKQSGFILLAVIWFVAIVGLGMTYLVQKVEDNIEQAIEEKRMLQEQLDQHNTEQTLLYLLSTREKSYLGLEIDRRFTPSNMSDPFSFNSYQPGKNTLKFDQTLYLGSGECVFSIQDSISLFSLRSKNYRDLSLFLEKEFSKSKAEIANLVASLRDYIDRDDRPRLAGAEFQKYNIKSRGIFPRNRYLVTKAELKNVAGWQGAFQSADWVKLLQEVTIHPGDRFNFNSLTKSRMNMLFKDIGIVEKVENYRQSNAFSSKDEIIKLTGLIDGDFFLRVAFFPSKHVILRTSCSEHQGYSELGITMTPKSKIQPWEVDYRHKVAGSPSFDRKNSKIHPVAEKQGFKRHPIFTNQ